jgi:hypothetical protein
VKDEVLAIYRERIFAFGPFVRGAQMRQKAQRIHPTEIVGNQIMKNGVQRTAAVGRHMTSSVSHLGFIGHLDFPLVAIVVGFRGLTRYVKNP